MNDTRDLFLRLCGIDVADVAVPHRLLRLQPDERNAHTIEQAAAQLLTRLRSSAGQIPAPHLDWMTQQVISARNFMLMQCGQPQPTTPGGPPPVPGAAGHAAWAPNRPPADDPPVAIRASVPRRRSGIDTENLIGIVSILVMLVAAGVGAKLFHDLWWREVIKRPVRNPIDPSNNPPPEPFKPSNVGGAPKPPRPLPRPMPGPDDPPADVPAAADPHMKAALENCRKGFFDEAVLDAQKACEADPACEEAEAMQVAVGYLRQYSTLADEALAALNENCIVDLGPKHGQAAFLSRDATKGGITFQVKGRPKKFSAEELRKIPGLRFRVTRDFLDNAKNPANDLILGAYHFVARVDAEGNPDRRRSLDAARSRWEKAAKSSDEPSRDQAALLITLLAWELDHELR